MSKAADKALGKNSELIAQSLVDSTLKGNASSAKLLLSLSEEQAKGENRNVRSGRRSVAGMLAAEPQWGAEPREIDSEKAAVAEPQQSSTATIDCSK
jgi:hypothetical protein